jgi:hypothetical protein
MAHNNLFNCGINIVDSISDAPGNEIIIIVTLNARDKTNIFVAFRWKSVASSEKSKEIGSGARRLWLKRA